MIILGTTGRFKIDPEHLAPQQLDYYHAIQWLVNDGPRRSGRSHILALAFIQKAMDYPERRIPVFDHYQESQRTSNECIMHEIIKCVNMLKNSVDGSNFPFNFNINFQNSSITATYKKDANTYRSFFGKWGS